MVAEAPALSTGQIMSMTGPQGSGEIEGIFGNILFKSFPGVNSVLNVQGSLFGNITGTQENLLGQIAAMPTPKIGGTLTQGVSEGILPGQGGKDQGSSMSMD